MLELALAQFAVEALPQSIQFGAQGIQFGFDGRRSQGISRFLSISACRSTGHQFVAEAAMSNAVVEVQFTGCESFAYLTIDPELVAVAAQTGRIAGVVEFEKVRPQSLGDGARRDFGERTLRESLLAGETRPSSSQAQRAMGWPAGPPRIRAPCQRPQILFEPRRHSVDRLPAQFDLADRLSHMRWPTVNNVSFGMIVNACFGPNRTAWRRSPPRPHTAAARAPRAEPPVAAFQPLA